MEHAQLRRMTLEQRKASDDAFAMLSLERTVSHAREVSRLLIIWEPCLQASPSPPRAT